MARKLKIPDGADQHFLAWASELFDQLGLDDAKAQIVVDRYQQYATARVSAANVERQRDIDAFKAELGSGYTAAIAAGQKAARSLGLDGKTLDRLQGDMGTAPLLRLLSAVGKRLDASASPPAANNSSAGGNDPLSSPEQAKAEIEKLSRSKEWSDKLFDPKAEGHAQAKELWTQLHAAGYPSAEPAAAGAPAAPASGLAKTMWEGLPQDVREATLKRDAGGNAKDAIEALLANDGFMASLRDVKHADHQANRATFDDLHKEAGIKV